MESLSLTPCVPASFRQPLCTARYQIWDLAKCCAGAEGGLKLTLTGHIHSIRGLAVSARHPYLFSAGEDKLVKCKSAPSVWSWCICYRVSA
jgi:hypothetical protein